MAYDTPFEAKPNTGSLFRNKFKKGDQPDMRGELVLDKMFLTDLINNSADTTIKVSISGWTKQSEKVGKFLSLNIGLPYVKPEEDLPY